MADRIIPWLRGFAVLFLAAGLIFAFFLSPPDYQQGESVRLMYVHVPAAWAAMAGYAAIGIMSGIALVWRHALAEIGAEAASPIGAVFTLVALISGALWGKPIWGAYWVWDARLTSFLLLFFLYLGHGALLNAFEDKERGRRSAAILAIVGLVNLPIIKFSVEWWNTLHQPASLLRLARPAIDISMLRPLLLMAIAFSLIFALVVILRMKAILIETRLRQARLNPKVSGTHG